MTPLEAADWGVLAAILVMAAATYAMRAGGFWLVGQFKLTVRQRRMLEALPGSVVVSAVLPVVVRDGLAAALAILAAGAVMFLCRNDALAVIAGLATAAAVRFAGF